MSFSPLAIPDLLLFEPKTFGDDRGYFYESYNKKEFDAAVGREVVFVQDNRSHSLQGVLRGLHYQVKRPQGKFVSVTQGSVFDVAVDIRRSSPTFGKWAGAILSAENRRSLWIPEGFAHGFYVLSPSADFQYKVTDFWSGEHERCVRFDDPELGITWPALAPQSGANFSPILSSKDRAGQLLRDAEYL